MPKEYKIRFSVMPKEGILDPAGRTVQRAINDKNGFDLPQVTDVKVGRIFIADVSAESLGLASVVLDRIAELPDSSNPLIEQIGAKTVTEITPDHAGK